MGNGLESMSSGVFGLMGHRERVAPLFCSIWRASERALNKTTEAGASFAGCLARVIFVNSMGRMRVSKILNPEFRVFKNNKIQRDPLVC